MRAARAGRARRGERGRRRRATCHVARRARKGVRMASAAPPDRGRSREYAQMGLSARGDRSRRCSAGGPKPTSKRGRPQPQSHLARLAAHGAPAFPPRGLLLRDHPRVTPLRLPRTARGALSHVERLVTRAEFHVALCRPLPRELVARSRARSRRFTAHALDVSGAPAARLVSLETAAAAHGAARRDVAEYKRKLDAVHAARSSTLASAKRQRDAAPARYACAPRSRAPWPRATCPRRSRSRFSCARARARAQR